MPRTCSPAAMAPATTATSGPRCCRPTPTRPSSRRPPAVRLGAGHAGPERRALPPRSAGRAVRVRRRNPSPLVAARRVLTRSLRHSRHERRLTRRCRLQDKTARARGPSLRAPGLRGAQRHGMRACGRPCQAAMSSTDRRADTTSQRHAPTVARGFAPELPRFLAFGALDLLPVIQARRQRQQMLQHPLGLDLVDPCSVMST